MNALSPKESKKPNFFIVGAPKCGTTALQDYLVQHPDIFMPSATEGLETVMGGKKELHYFGSDLAFGGRDLEKYLAYFAPAGEQSCLGEASVFYLYSQQAAAEIKAFNPQARIIIMLRNPVDVMYSWHSQQVYWGDEDIPDFQTALAAERDRQQGQRLPNQPDHPIPCFFYQEIVKFTEQVQRYFDVFGREQVHVIIFDDFTKDTLHSYQQTLNFLGVDASFVPELKVVNANKTVRNPTLQKFLRNPPPWLKSLGKSLTPTFLYRGARTKMLRYNIQEAPRSAMNEDLRRELMDKLSPEVEQLSSLLGRDLTYWSHPAT
jgi:hypothetical protein